MKLEIVEDLKKILPIIILSASDIKVRDQGSIEKLVDEPPFFSTGVFDEFDEGGTSEIIVEIRKRDRRLRSQAIAHYGLNCYVCGFNFEKIYKELGAGYIEIHHLVPLSNSDGECTNTVLDVRVVCANCHRVLHRNGSEPIDIDYLRKMLLENQRKDYS